MLSPEKAAQLFKILSDANRLNIMKRLVEGETCGCTLIQNLPISQPTLSYHLDTLTKNQFTFATKEGTWKKHVVNKNQLNELIQFLIDLRDAKTSCDRP
jgi:ArsR family transcriptional regulator, arsenate/arsenite/antimonite-responsive transcriptional repressor